MYFDFNYLQLGGKTSKYGKSYRNIAVYRPEYNNHYLVPGIYLATSYMYADWTRLPEDAKILSTCV